MSARFLGAHMPTGKGLGAAIRAGRDIGCTAVQVFTSSPQQWKAKEPTQESIQAFRDACAETGIDHVISHDSYLVNLCAVDPEIQAKSVSGLQGELRRCDAYGIRWAVSHMGSHLGQGVEVGLQRVAEAALQVLHETPETVTLCMETTAGQGSALNDRFEQIASLLDLTGGPSRLGVCLDTCHIFAAGYDLRTVEACEATFAEFERLIGFDRLHVVHANDSKKPLGSRVDRHAALGEGEIGETAFRWLVNDPRFETIPIVIETPDAETMHAVNLGRLLAWRQ